MGKKVKKAFEAYDRGEKTFAECQQLALVSLLGEPYESVLKAEKR